MGPVPRRQGAAQETRAGGDGEQDRRGDHESMKQHGSEYLPGQGRGGGRGGLPGDEAERGPGRGVAQGGRHGRGGGPVTERRGDGRGGQDDAAAGQATAELVARPGQPAPDRPGRPVQPAGHLVEGQPLEIAEHHGEPKRLRQAIDLVVQGLGLFAADRRFLARFDRRPGQDSRIRTPGNLSSRHHSSARPLQAAPDGPSNLRARADRHAVKPGAQQVGIAGSLSPCSPGRGTAAWNASSSIVRVAQPTI